MRNNFEYLLIMGHKTKRAKRVWIDEGLISWGSVSYGGCGESGEIKRNVQN